MKSLVLALAVASAVAPVYALDPCVPVRLVSCQTDPTYKGCPETAAAGFQFFRVVAIAPQECVATETTYVWSMVTLDGEGADAYSWHRDRRVGVVGGATGTYVVVATHPVSRQSVMLPTVILPAGPLVTAVQ